MRDSASILIESFDEASESAFQAGVVTWSSVFGDEVTEGHNVQVPLTFDIQSVRTMGLIKTPLAQLILS